ncbi:MAG: LytTR family DNA-binding domain-containing protein [bacterium]|nr:LytTR family DNA-binding domain-containing protein [bacterium]
MPLNIALCDDEMLDIEREKELIESVLTAWPHSINWGIDVFTSSEDMLKSNKTYNMVFLDVEMCGMNGIETAEALHKKSPVSLIFFVTHHEDYMDEALNKHAFRFWTKPINRARLIYGIQSAVKEIKICEKIVNVMSDRKMIQIPLRDILYIYHIGRHTCIVTADGTYTTTDTFKNVAGQLTDVCFFETHASCYVNLNYVSDYSKTGITCSYNGKKYNALISTRKYAAFNKRFKEWSCGLR